jgi:hypothetical protein
LERRGMASFFGSNVNRDDGRVYGSAVPDPPVAGAIKYRGTWTISASKYLHILQIKQSYRLRA